MNQAGLTRRISEMTGYRLNETTEFIRAFKEALTQGLLEDRRVSLRDLGTFEVVERKERQGRNPNNNELVTIPAHISAKMRCGDTLQKRIEEKYMN